MKKTIFLIHVMVMVALCVPYTSAYGCSTFCYREGGHLLVGKNFDFYLGDGRILVNKRNLSKVSFPIPGEKTIRWTSKYGSITFNQVGREFPFGGMNEKGLVIEQMYLHDTQYPEADSRSGTGIAELQWIQYQLDNCASVTEVLATDSILRISKYSVPLHFMIVDAMGNVATFEYVNGKTVIHNNSNLPVCALTNDTYENSFNYFNSKAYPSDIKFKPTSYGRFVATAQMLETFNAKQPVDYSFDLLNSVRQDDFTKWSIVYDIRNMTIHIKTLNNPQRRQLRVNDFNFSCSSTVLFADIDEQVNGPKQFSEYTSSANLKIIEHTFDILATKPEFANIIPPKEEQRAMAIYPDQAHCGQQ